jgi:hypothetical protein
MQALAYATGTVPNFKLRLVRRSGEVRLEHWLSIDDGRQIWSVLRSFADRFGETGDFLQVFDETAEMVIRVGVDTAKSVTAKSVTAKSAAARSVKAPTPVHA